jgi:hypothetical protein
MISKSEFLKLSALKRKTVQIDSMNSTIEIVEFDLISRAKLLELSRKGDEKGIAAVLLKSCVPCLADATEAEIEGIAFAVVDEIQTAVFELSGLTEATEKN